MQRVVVALAALFICHLALAAEGKVYLNETLASGWPGRWVTTTVPKYNGVLRVEEPSAGGPAALHLPDNHRYYGAAAPFSETFQPGENQDIVVQYEVKLTRGLECGGAYVKLVRGAVSDLQLPTLSDATPYTIMFGPDKCGYETNKVHFILQHQNQRTGEWEEKHFTKPPAVKLDALWHQYTLVVHADNSFEILIDNEEAARGNLLHDMNPPVNPPETIDDPTDLKPADWVDEEMIADPNARKPDDWDETAPREIPDPSAEKPEGWLDDAPAMVADPAVAKPEDWDDEEDGEWMAPLIPNPECEAVGCGEWRAPMIRNPAYKGPWSPELIPNPAYKGPFKPRQIPNPAFERNEHPARTAPMAALAVEVWTVTGGIQMANFLVTDSAAAARRQSEFLFAARHAAEVEQQAREKPASAGDGPLDAVRQALAPVQRWMDMQPQLAAGVASAVAVVVASMCWCMCCRRSSKPARTGTADTASAASTTGTTAPADDAAHAASEAAPAAETTPSREAHEDADEDAPSGREPERKPSTGRGGVARRPRKET